MNFLYTEKNVIEAGKIVALAAGVERKSSEAILNADTALPRFLEFAAKEYFVWGDPEPREKDAAAVAMVRRALKQLNREGAFKFQEPVTEE